MTEANPLPGKEEAERALKVFADRLEHACEVFDGAMFSGERGTAYAYPSQEVAGEFRKIEDAHFYVVARCTAPTLLALARIGFKAVYQEEVERVARAMVDASRARNGEGPITDALWIEIWSLQTHLPSRGHFESMARAALDAMR